MLLKQLPRPFVPTILAIALATAAHAQVSNITSELGYNNVERGFDATNTEFGFNQQFFFTPNPPTTFVESPATDVVVTNPTTGGAAELRAHTQIGGTLSSTSTSVLLSGTGFSSSSILSRDGTSTYQSVPATQADVSMHLATAETVTFSVDSFNEVNGGVCVYGIDNTFVSDFTTNGNHTYSATLAAGDHSLFLYFFADSLISAPGEVSTSSSGNYSISVNPVPEPASLSVLGLGAIALIRRRRKARACLMLGTTKPGRATL